MNRFIGKTVVITGAAKGIGRATAIAFANEGANVVINYLTSELAARELVNEIVQAGGTAVALKADVTIETEVISLISTAISEFGRIDILVNNAGFVKGSGIFEKTVEDWTKSLQVNLIGPYLCIKHAAKNMLKVGGGKIINISSTSAIHSFYPDIADYDASKAGIIALTKNFAKELAPNVRVNAIAPGWVHTDMSKDISAELTKSEMEKIYLKRFAQPNEIAKAVLFFACEDSSYISGTTLLVDGGHD